MSAEPGRILDLVGLAADTINTTGIKSGKRPTLYPMGIPEFDDRVGGFGPGSLVVVAMDTGVGKSRLATAAAYHAARAGTHTAIISTEDPEDVVGVRLLSYLSEIDQLKIRRGDLTQQERERLIKAANERATLTNLDFGFCVGYSIDAIIETARRMIDRGARVVWLDYLQKVRGVSDDRRAEVGRVLGRFQEVCARGKAVPVVLSQFSRRDTTTAPKLHHIKESGDVENEARVVMLGWADAIVPGRVNMKVAKSTFGCQGLEITRDTDKTTGWLVPAIKEDSSSDLEFLL